MDVAVRFCGCGGLEAFCVALDLFVRFAVLVGVCRGCLSLRADFGLIVAVFFEFGLRLWLIVLVLFFCFRFLWMFGLLCFVDCVCCV